MTAADQTFQLALRFIDDAVMTRRSASHFSDVDFRNRREAEAEEFSRTAMNLVSGRVTALPAAS